MIQSFANSCIKNKGKSEAVTSWTENSLDWLLPPHGCLSSMNEEETDYTQVVTPSLLNNPKGTFPRLDFFGVLCFVASRGNLKMHPYPKCLDWQGSMV